MRYDPVASRRHGGNPPHHSRFKPGQSGNPKGRPKGRKDLQTVIDRELNKFVTITENGKAKRITKQEVIIQRLAHDSIKGQHRATELLMRLVREVSGGEAQETSAAAQPVPDKAVLKRLMARLDRLVSDEE